MSDTSPTPLRVQRERRRHELKQMIRAQRILRDEHQDHANKLRSDIHVTCDYGNIPKSATAERKAILEAACALDAEYCEHIDKVSHYQVEIGENEDLVSGIDYSIREREIEAQRDFTVMCDRLIPALESFSANIDRLLMGMAMLDAKAGLQRAG